MTKATLELGRGEVVSRRSPAFIEGLREWSRANYMLVDGGEAESVKSTAELRELTIQLFRELVVDETDAARTEYESRRLKVTATELWKSLGMWERPDFRRDQPTFYKLFGENRPFTFDYAVGPSEAPYSVCHRVVLGHQRSFDSVLMNLEHYCQFRRFEKGRCGAMVLPAEAADARLRDTNLRVLAHVATVIDLSNKRDARHAAMELAAMNGKP